MEEADEEEEEKDVTASKEIFHMKSFLLSFKMSQYFMVVPLQHKIPLYMTYVTSNFTCKRQHTHKLGFWPSSISSSGMG